MNRRNMRIIFGAAVIALGVTMRFPLDAVQVFAGVILLATAFESKVEP